jgi:hypothetical protein
MNAYAEENIIPEVGHFLIVFNLYYDFLIPDQLNFIHTTISYYQFGKQKEPLFSDPIHLE